MIGIYNQMLQSTYARLCFSARKSLPCQVRFFSAQFTYDKQIVGLTHTVIMLEEDTVELIVSAMVRLLYLLQF